MFTMKIHRLAVEPTPDANCLNLNTVQLMLRSAVVVITVCTSWQVVFTTGMLSCCTSLLLVNTVGEDAPNDI